MTQLYFLKTWMQTRFETAEERGANLVEYILLIGLIVLLVLGAVFVLRGAIQNRFSDAGDAVENAS